MAPLTLKSLLRPRAGILPALTAICDALGPGLGIEDPAGHLLYGLASSGRPRNPILAQEIILGWVTGPTPGAAVLALLLTHLAAKESESRALSGEVLHLYREVHLIDQLSEQLTSLLNPATVGKSALEQAVRLISATIGTVLVHDKADGELHAVASFGDTAASLGVDSPFVQSVVTRGVAEIVDDGHSDSRLSDHASGLRAFIAAPLRAKHRTIGVIVLANPSPSAYSAADLKLLNTIALQTAAAVENSILAADMVHAARDREQLAAMQKEMETARTIQHSLVPRVFPPFPHRTDFDLHAQMTSARAVGGDFFDFFLIDDDRLGVVIGDVSGKGTPSALFMAVTRTHIKTNALRGISPVECLIEVNQALVNDKASSMFATCFYGILNTRTGDLDFCNAGHNPPYLRRATGTVETMPEASGPPLGMFAWKTYSGGQVRLFPGDTLFLSTDGVSEANNADLDDFTDERLIAVLHSGDALDSRSLIDLVYREILAFSNGAPQSDDITMLSVRLTPPA